MYLFKLSNILLEINKNYIKYFFYNVQ